ncbi:hypothetical protein BJ742DRAFT_820677 [Cladochytrium replicatum]|nr:hypothetical protein BJ742DRAFT_820677 [Cladochytrium replicatum]
MEGRTRRMAQIREQEKIIAKKTLSRFRLSISNAWTLELQKEKERWEEERNSHLNQLLALQQKLNSSYGQAYADAENLMLGNDAQKQKNLETVHRQLATEDERSLVAAVKFESDELSQNEPTASRIRSLQTAMAVEKDRAKKVAAARAEYRSRYVDVVPETMSMPVSRLLLNTREKHRHYDHTYFHRDYAAVRCQEALQSTREPRDRGKLNAREAASPAAHQTQTHIAEKQQKLERYRGRADQRFTKALEDVKMEQTKFELELELERLDRERRQMNTGRQSVFQRPSAFAVPPAGVEAAFSKAFGISERRQ